jgi:hypothetical protein
MADQQLLAGSAVVFDAIKTLAIVAGVVISVITFKASQEAQAKARRIEASKPFLELRQKLYAEALTTAAVLANPGQHSAAELAAADKRFRALYVAELSTVETPAIEARMRALAAEVAPDLLKMTPAQVAAYDLAHALRDSYRADWGVPEVRPVPR